MELFHSQQWCRDSRFSSFWAHYNAVERWRADHARMASIACRIALEKISCQRRGRGFTNKHIGRPNRERMRAPYRRTMQAESRSYEENVEPPSDMDTTSVRDDEEEMSEEMVEFFKKTIEHRKKPGC
ncbi:hypothetical protein KIN20_026380 [Parelaphostrongylus tenuis]|uniref:Uncharacterized protein n=1 Tax=Parelaphostrongylus tenuis TaxID=148309 RepID=A0AAD5QXY8_PARTN|nr:hypothetical protein KIN20_026380 [Parelaphostrongylus tenuis]